LVLVAGVALMGACGEAADREPSTAAGEWRTVGCLAPRAGAASRLGDVLGRIERGGREQFAESFAGVEIDEARQRGIVYRVPSAAFDDFVRTAAADACIVVRDAAYSGKTLAGWHDRVLADLPYWSHRGVRIVTIGARHDGSGVEVGVRDVPPARSAMLARYGRDAPLLFESQEPVRPLPGEASPT
jgi:hypothetical protein